MLTRSRICILSLIAVLASCALNTFAVAQAVPLGASVDVAQGSDPDVCVDNAGNLHFAYVRSGSVIYRKLNTPYSSGQLGPEILVGSGTNPQIETDSQNRPHISYGGGLYARWNGIGFTTVAAFAGWRKSHITIDQNDHVYIVGDIYSPRQVAVRAFLNGSPLVGYTCSVGPDNPGGVTINDNGVVYTTSRSGGAHHISAYSLAANRYSTSIDYTTIQGGTSDFSDVAVDPTDQSVHYVGTVGYAQGIFYRSFRNGVWSSTVTFDPYALAEDGDHVNPCIAADMNGMKYITYSHYQSAGRLIVLGSNDAVVQGTTVFGYEAGSKLTNPNVASRPDMSGAYVTWGTSTVRVRSIGNVQIGTSVNLLPRALDFDGDGIHDGYRVISSQGTLRWRYAESSTGERHEFSFGVSSDTPVPGAFDSSQPGVDLPAIWRPSTGEWIVRTSDDSSEWIYSGYGIVGDTPVVGDFDGDGTDDFSVFRPSTEWFHSEAGVGMSVGDISGTDLDLFAFDAWNPVTASSYDADRKDDLVLFDSQAATWYIACTDGTRHSYQFGLAGRDLPAPGDFDGDGHIDFAVTRASDMSWRFAPSSGGGQISAASWGVEGDLPVPGRYSDNSRYLLAVFRSDRYLIVRPETGGIRTIDVERSARALQSVDTTPSDFNGDGIHDLCTVQVRGSGTSARLLWTIRDGDTTERTQLVYGLEDDLPAPGAFNPALPLQSVPAVWRQSTGEWIAKAAVESTQFIRSTTPVGRPGDFPLPIDLNGDGVDVFAVYRPDTGEVITESTARFIASYPESSVNIFAFDAFNPITGRSYDTDTADDIVIYRRSSGDWMIFCSDGTKDSYHFGKDGEDTPCPGDYDGDGLYEFAVYRNRDQKWRMTYTSSGLRAADRKWGVSGDMPAPGRYSLAPNWCLAILRDGTIHAADPVGDQKLGDPPVYAGGAADALVMGRFSSFVRGAAMASFNPASGRWIAAYADGSAEIVKWGIPEDTPVVGDWDNDGTDDFTVFRNGWWIADRSTFGRLDVKWGVPGDLPLVYDFDGDDQDDRCIYRNGYWIADQTTDGRLDRKWGVSTDIPFPGDYDGDNETDLAVYRPSTGYWIISGSKNGRMDVKCGVPTGMRAGTSVDDIPVAEDFNGDGATDCGVFVPSLAKYVYANVTSTVEYAEIACDFVTGSDALRPAVADYDGDGVLEMAVHGGWDIGAWFVRLSSTQRMVIDPRVGIMMGGGALIGVR